MQNPPDGKPRRTSEKKALPPPAVLTVAGLDPSSGAGFTADLKVFAAHGLYGLACPTALTVQSTAGVRRTEPVAPEYVADALACLAEDIAIAGVKIGMLGSAGVVRAVAEWLGTYRVEAVVLDPVFRSSSGHMLLDPEGLARLRDELLPLVSVLTPNLPEAAALASIPVGTRADVRRAAGLLLGQTRAVVVTGGHLREPATPDDFLLTAGDPDGTWFPGLRVHTPATHGTGCAFSSALLANLVRGQALPEAVRAAKAYVRAALEHAYPLGRGRGPVNHLYKLPESPATGPEPSK